MDAAISVTGNTVIDALLETVKTPGPLPPFPRRGTRLVLVTAHRRENFGAPLEEIVDAIREIAERWKDVDVVYPVHRNPQVDGPVRAALGKTAGVHLLAPVDYKTFCDLMSASTLILTDSGGIQEEAPSLGIPVLVLRDETERPEAVEAGVVRLVGPHREAIVENVAKLLENPKAYATMATRVNPYGDGHASVRIVAKVKGLLGA